MFSEALQLELLAYGTGNGAFSMTFGSERNLFFSGV
jgi:hypothetical protein